ncbi:hypothetical protein GJ654_13595 [Rhodoblastus acidophilus]|uniref:Uncharacterized protein n=1 Tax=Rhodoblastus acidophilus TaxID=1074 RepID=A0A6N8DS67_RHOAC|nr:hypothetical protein [Rhodoblastus acidophilus]MCW2275422.1 hypothetical protein [Rhodoblastus acidophilus]MTV32021.1 hypothetical protein [Rhodoblastus acidophilus]
MPAPANVELITSLSRDMAISVVALSSCFMIVGAIAFWRAGAGQAKTFSLLIQRSQALQMATVVLIIVGACTLRILDSISSEAVVSILSGIAGYVLGGRSRADTKADNENSN